MCTYREAPGHPGIDLGSDNMLPMKRKMNKRMLGRGASHYLKAADLRPARGWCPLGGGRPPKLPDALWASQPARGSTMGAVCKTPKPPGTDFGALGRLPAGPIAWCFANPIPIVAPRWAPIVRPLSHPRLDLGAAGVLHAGLLCAEHPLQHQVALLLWKSSCTPARGGSGCHCRRRSAALADAVV